MLNYDTFKAIEFVVTKIERLKPADVRDSLYKVLEKFTTQHFQRFSTLQGPASISDGLPSERSNRFSAASQRQNTRLNTDESNTNRRDTAEDVDYYEDGQEQLIERAQETSNNKRTTIEIKVDPLEATEDDELPVVHAPYLPMVDSTYKGYTLVLDLDETLIHYFDTPLEKSRKESILSHTGQTRVSNSELVEDSYGAGYFMIRPSARNFLNRMAKHYEVVIFTAAMQDYADWVLDNLDTEHSIKFRLFRQHADREGPVFVKDLSKLGRDLKRIIIVDNVAQNF